MHRQLRQPARRCPCRAHVAQDKGRLRETEALVSYPAALAAPYACTSESSRQSAVQHPQKCNQSPTISPCHFSRICPSLSPRSPSPTRRGSIAWGSMSLVAGALMDKFGLDALYTYTFLARSVMMLCILLAMLKTMQGPRPITPCRGVHVCRRQAGTSVVDSVNAQD